MKLLYCPNCRDVFSLNSKEKTCTCRQTRGQYIDNLNAVYSGGIPLGMGNVSLNHALRHRPQNGLGQRFDAWVIPIDCPTFKEEII